MPTRNAATSPGDASAAQPASPDAIRNVVLVGPAGSGKTTLVEALLAATGATNRMGSVEEGTTTSDYDEAEIRQQRSVGLSLAPVMVAGTKVNLLDAPGYADFVGDLRAGLRAADCALFVVSASQGVDGMTKALWQECQAVGMPRTVVISKLNHPRADYATVLASAQAAFGDKVVPLYVPVHHDGSDIDDLAALISQTVCDYSGGAGGGRTIREPDDDEQLLI
ncbi:MAG: GTP-binding protein, partial [Lapillicoccus sp.]